MSDLVPFKELFPIAAIQEDDLQELVHQNLEGEQITRFDLERITVASGGMPAFKLRRGEAVDSIKDFHAIIIHQQSTRAYYTTSMAEGGGGTPPDCSSADAVTGIGDNGEGQGVHQCTTCPQNVWGTAVKDGKQMRGKACGEYKAVVLYREKKKGIFPSVLNVPPTSLRALKDYNMTLTDEGILRDSALHKFSAKPDKNNDGTPYTSITIAFVRKLTEEELASISVLGAAMKNVIAANPSALQTPFD